MTGLGNDLRYALRSLARRPGMAVAAIATPALGIRAEAGRIPMAVAFSRILASQLFGLSARDPAVLAAAAAVPLTAGALAAWLPARRASRVDPVTALRSE